jgi:hypothetical protein
MSATLTAMVRHLKRHQRVDRCWSDDGLRRARAIW